MRKASSDFKRRPNTALQSDPRHPALHKIRRILKSGIDVSKLYRKEKKDVLNNNDLDTLVEMVKDRLEYLILQRANEGKTNQDKTSLNAEIDKLYRLLAKLIVKSDINFTNDNSRDKGSSTGHNSSDKESGTGHFGDKQINDDRIEFIQSLRVYWSSLTYAVSSAIQYTRNGEPQRSEFDRICVLLSQSIDNLRMFYTNIQTSPNDHHGLYPFEPIKDILRSFANLGYDQSDQSMRSNARDEIVSSWQSMREPFLSEFSRTTPINPVSRYIRE